MKFVHCGSHGAIHAFEDDGSCWCGCVGDLPDVGDKNLVIEADDKKHAYRKAVLMGRWLYSNEATPICSRLCGWSAPKGRDTASAADDSGYDVLFGGHYDPFPFGTDAADDGWVRM